MTNDLNRRDFVKTATTAAAATVVIGKTALGSSPIAKRRYAIVGTGDRGTTMWGKPLVADYPDLIEFVGLCDINPKRVEVAKKLMGVSCPTFTNFDQMLDQTKPDLLMVTTVDGFHSHYSLRHWIVVWM